MPPSDVKIVLEELLVVGSDVEGDSQDFGGVNAGGESVDDRFGCGITSEARKVCQY